MKNKKTAQEKPKSKKSPAAADSKPVRIGLEPSEREISVRWLKTILADQHVLYLKTRNFHWNLTGPRFSSLHKFFEAQYVEIEKAIDETAERIRMIGGIAPGSMGEFLGLAALTEESGKLIPGETAIEILKNDHETAVRSLREAIDEIGNAGDVGTEDFLTQLIRTHEQSAWMLRSYLD